MAVDAETKARMQKWADGKATLKDVRGYTPEQLYAVARTGYFFYYQGKLDEARTIFQGLYAVDPTDAYVAKAMAVVELASGNTQGALGAYDVAIKLDPNDSMAYVSRAEVKIALGQRSAAGEDLRAARRLADPSSDIFAKASAMLEILSKK